MGLFLPRLSTKHMSRLTFHLWSLYRGGTSLRRAFELLDDKAFALPLRRVGREVAHYLHQGETLAGAMSHVDDKIPVVARNLITVGELSGGLERALERLHRYYEWRLTIQRRILRLVSYPILLFISAYIIEFVKGAVLTNQDIYVYTLEYFQRLAWYLGTRLAVLVMTMRILDQWGYLTPLIDNITARAPGVRGVFVPLALARFFRCLRMMLDSGCHVVTALETALRGASNTVIERQLARAIPAVKDGTPILEAMAATGALPRLVRDMLVTGEFSGRSEENLEAAADYIEAEATTVFRLIGGCVGIFLIAVILLSMFHYAAMVGYAFYNVYIKRILDALAI